MLRSPLPMFKHIASLTPTLHTTLLLCDVQDLGPMVPETDIFGIERMMYRAYERLCPAKVKFRLFQSGGLTTWFRLLHCDQWKLEGPIFSRIVPKDCRVTVPSQWMHLKGERRVCRNYSQIITCQLANCRKCCSFIVKRPLLFFIASALITVFGYHLWIPLKV